MSELAGLVGATAALVAAIGGFLGVREYRLKAAAQRVEIDVRLSQLLAELVPTANGWGRSELSETAADTIAKKKIESGAPPKQASEALRGAVVTFPVGEAEQAVAITTIGYLGVEHRTLREAAYRALQALEFVHSRPRLAAARAAALEAIDAVR